MSSWVIRTFPIPCAAGHDVVYGLARGRGDEIYLAPSNEFCPGLCAAVFAFDPRRETFRPVIDVQAATGFDPASGLMPHSKIHLCLHSTAEGRLFAATHFTAPAIGQTSFDAIAAYRGGYPGTFILEYDPARDEVVNHGRMAAGEGARIACLDERHGQFYFLSYPRNHLFRYDYERRVVHDLGRIGQENAFGLECDPEGNVFTSDDLGQIVRYSLKHDRLEALPLFVPIAPGRRTNANYIRRMVRTGDGCLWGFGNKGMRLFRLDPSALSIEDFGVILGQDPRNGRDYPCLPPAKAMVPTASGSLLIAFGGDGIYQDDQSIPTLVEFDPSTRSILRQEPLRASEDGLPAWIPQCAVASKAGDAFYFGLQQAAEPLRLWKVEAAPRPAAPLRSAAAELQRRHREGVDRVPFGASVEGTAPLPFILGGRVHLEELGWAGEDRTIPPGEAAIAALAWTGEDTLYGLTVGHRPHLFSYRPYRQNRFTENYETHPWDLGAIGSRPATAGQLFLDEGRRRLWIALETEEGLELWSFAVGSEEPRYRGIYHSVPHGPPVRWEGSPFTHVGTRPATAVGFGSLCYLAEEGILLATDSDGRLLRASPGEPFAPLSLDFPVHPGGLAAVDPTHCYVLGRDGTARILHAQASKPWLAGSVLPAPPSPPTAFAAERRGGRFAVGTANGEIQIVDGLKASSAATFSLGRPGPIRALAWNSLGELFGFQGDDDRIGDAFRLDPVRGLVENLGILQATSQPRFWACHRCDALAAGRDGEVYFGEHDRIAHLAIVRVAGDYPNRGDLPSGRGSWRNADRRPTLPAT